MKATITTNKGVITLELDATAAPKTCANFKRYADEGHYDNTIFHRVIPNFMIQGGGFSPDMNQKSTHETIENEAANGLKNDLGTVAMARTPDPHSASSQFFINLTNNDFLNFRDESQAGFGYCVFGKTIDGHGHGQCNRGSQHRLPRRPSRRPDRTRHHRIYCGH